MFHAISAIVADTVMAVIVVQILFAWFLPFLFLVFSLCLVCALFIYRCSWETSSTIDWLVYLSLFAIFFMLVLVCMGFLLLNSLPLLLPIMGRIKSKTILLIDPNTFDVIKRFRSDYDLIDLNLLHIFFGITHPFSTEMSHVSSLSSASLSSSLSFLSSSSFIVISSYLLLSFPSSPPHRSLCGMAHPFYFKVVLGSLIPN